MQLDLTREDLINLVKGTSPSYEAMSIKNIARCGRYTGGFHDKWNWVSFPADLTERDLLEIYNLCKR